MPAALLSTFARCRVALTATLVPSALLLLAGALNAGVMYAAVTDGVGHDAGAVAGIAAAPSAVMAGAAAGDGRVLHD
jgi:hypothetical protein